MPTEATWYEEIKAIVYKFIVGWSTVPKSSDDLVKKLVPILKYNIRKQTLFFHWIIIFVIVEILEILFNSSSVLKYELFLYSSFRSLYLLFVSLLFGQCSMILFFQTVWSSTSINTGNWFLVHYRWSLWKSYIRKS